jgi:hypothetical protein
MSLIAGLVARSTLVPSEADATRAELGDFDFKSSPAHKVLVAQFGPRVRLIELKNIILLAVTYLSLKYGKVLPKMSRNTKRSLQLMIKYINANYDDLVPVLRKMTLCDSEKQAMDLSNMRSSSATD